VLSECCCCCGGGGLQYLGCHHIQILYEHTAGGGRRQRLPQQLARSNTLCTSGLQGNLRCAYTPAFVLRALYNTTGSMQLENTAAQRQTGFDTAVGTADI